MTLQELNAHLALVQELQELQKIYDRMAMKAAPGAQRLDGMPHSSDPGDPTADLGVQLAELRTVIEQEKAAIRVSAGPVKAFIDAIPKYRVRLIFQMRFLSGKSWGEVADHIGATVTEQAVKKVCYKQIEGGDPDDEELLGPSGNAEER